MSAAMVDNTMMRFMRSLLFPEQGERPAPFAYGTTLHLGAVQYNPQMSDFAVVVAASTPPNV